MAEWSRIVNSTIHQFIREVEGNIVRNRKLLAMMKSRGRISFGHSGDLMDWKVRYKRAPMQGYADSDTLTFARRERLKTAQLDWRGYAATDSMTKKERLMNSNMEAIVKLYSEIASNLMDDMEDQFADELLIDGNATGNTKRIHGFKSWTGYSGAATKQPIGIPNDTYAGLSCSLGNYGGAWSSTGSTSSSQGDWPSGAGDAHYDFWSPLIVDYTSAISNSASAGTTGWTASTKTWPNTCREALRYGIIKGKKNKSKKGQLDLIMLNDELYRQLEDKIEANEKINVNRNDPLGLFNLGFADTLNFDGVDVSYEYGVPAGEGYGWALEHAELCSLQKQLFVPEGPDFDISTQSWRFYIDFFGNMRANPRYMVLWKNIS
jgi:hypothetical protein